MSNIFPTNACKNMHIIWSIHQVLKRLSIVMLLLNRYSILELFFGSLGMECVFIPLCWFSKTNSHPCFSSCRREPGSRRSSPSPSPRWPKPRRSTTRHSGPASARWSRTTRRTPTSTCPGPTWRSSGWTQTSSGSRWTTARTNTPTSCRKLTSFRWD